jgi:hypothetical protein
VSLDRARRIADAVLLEGYVLYPYRASSTKNRWRFPFGVLAPRAWSDGAGCEPWWMESQCLVEPSGSAPPRILGRLRFLQARRRTIEADPVTWDEGALREIAFAGTPGADAPTEFALPAGVDEAPTGGAAAAGPRTVWRQAHICGRVQVRWDRVAADRPLLRMTVRAENTTPWADGRAPRDAVLPASCLAAHFLLTVEGGAFVSLLDPPAWARSAAVACRSTRAHPVLAGEPGERDLVLAAPIILYDHPRLAPESPGDFFDATEIDELLALRTATLTDDEKREARATDPRAAALLDRVDGLPPEHLARLHGAFRELVGDEMSPRPAGPASTALGPGARVRLCPGIRRTDAQDLLFAGRTATIRAVRRDVDDQRWLAVTVDDDPAAELHDWYGRYHYYREDEVEPLAAPEEGP